MKLNGHELTTIDLFKINMLNQHIENPKLLDFIWVKKYRRELTERLKRLEDSYNKKMVSDKSYTVYKKMINESLKTNKNGM